MPPGLHANELKRSAREFKTDRLNRSRRGAPGLLTNGENRVYKKAGAKNST
jgi:hypothetical protein